MFLSNDCSDVSGSEGAFFGTEPQEAVDVYFRDIEYMTGVFLMAWIWLTPIMYTYESIENVTWLHWVVGKNPMTPIITSYQNIIYYHRVPDMAALGRAAVFAVVLLIVGELIFNKFVKGIAEEL